jgi:hypothetical protein
MACCPGTGGRRRHRQGLNAGLYIEGDRHHPQLASRLALPVLMDDLNLLVDMQYRHHFGFQGGIPLFHESSESGEAKVRAAAKSGGVCSGSTGAIAGCPAPQRWRTWAVNSR